MLSKKGGRVLPGALLLFFFLVTSATDAGVSIQLSPPIIEKTVGPFTEINDIITFINPGTVPLNVTVEVVDFGLTPDGSVTDQPAGTNAATLAPYIRVNPVNVRIEPKEQVFFRYSIQLPADFTQLRAKLYFLCKPDVKAPPNSAVLAPRLGIPVYVENKNAESAQIDVQSIHWERDSEAPDSLKLRMKMKNHGERNIRPKGYVEVESKRDNFYKIFPFNEGKEPVLPGQLRDWVMKFGPVPSADLDIKLRFETSFKESFESKYKIPFSSEIALQGTTSTEQQGERP